MRHLLSGAQGQTGDTAASRSAPAHTDSDLFGMETPTKRTNDRPETAAGGLGFMARNRRVMHREQNQLKGQ